MRTRLLIAALGGLVIGLLVLVFFQARLIQEARHELGALSVPLPERLTNGSQRPIRLRLQDLPPVAIRTQIQQLDWRTVESEDYATYVANLRRIGCPEETVRDILLADINKLFAARRRTIPSAPTNAAYWLHPDEDPAYASASDEGRDREAELTAIERERRQLIGTLLGPAAAQAELTEFTEEELVSPDLQFLDPAKRRPLAEAQARYRQALADLEGITDPEQQRSLSRAAEKAFQDAITASLTPAEREQLELRTSPLARSLRDQLRGFGASREEFDTLYRLERQFAQEREQLEAAGTAGSDPQWRDKVEAAEIQLNESVRQALGPARDADLQRARDPDFQTLYSLAQDHEMPTTVAREVWDMRQTVAAHADAIRANPLLSASQKRAALEAIRTETQSAIVEVLGEPLLEEYQRQGGAWLGELTDPGLVAEVALPEPPSGFLNYPPLPPVPGARLDVPQPAPILPVP